MDEVEYEEFTEYADSRNVDFTKREQDVRERMALYAKKAKEYSQSPHLRHRISEQQIKGYSEDAKDLYCAQLQSILEERNE